MNYNPFSYRPAPHFDLYMTNGELYIKYTERNRLPGERGVWVPIGHQSEHKIEEVIRANRANGLDVALDEHGNYRVFVLKD